MIHAAAGQGLDRRPGQSGRVGDDQNVRPLSAEPRDGVAPEVRRRGVQPDQPQSRQPVAEPAFGAGAEEIENHPGGRRIRQPRQGDALGRSGAPRIDRAVLGAAAMEGEGVRMGLGQRMLRVEPLEIEIDQQAQSKIAGGGRQPREDGVGGGLVGEDRTVMIDRAEQGVLQAARKRRRDQEAVKAQP